MLSRTEAVDLPVSLHPYPHPALEWDCGYKGQERAFSEAGLRLRDGVKSSVSVIAVPVICQLRQLHSQ